MHATLVDSTIAAVDAWLGPLSRGVRAAFYAETVPIARLFGIAESHLPPDVDAFDDYIASMLAPSGPVHPSATARELAAVILHPPLAPAVESGPVATLLGDWARPSAAILRAIPTPAYDWLLVPAIGLLPPTVRDEYGFAWGDRERVIAAWLTTTWSLWRRVLPPERRWFPQALAADRRVGGG